MAGAPSLAGGELMPRKATPPITDGLSADDFLKRNPPAHETIKVLYRCRCRNTAELHIQVEAVVCVRCGSRMRPQI